MVSARSVHVTSVPGEDAVSTSAAAELSGLVDGLGVVVWEADVRARRFTFVSRHAESLLGYPTHRWLDEPDFLTFLIHPDDRADVTDARRRGAEERDDFELTYRAVAADGRIVWLQDNTRVVRDAAGTPRRLRGVLVDVSARRADEERHRFLAVLERELQQSDDAEQVMATATRVLREHLGGDRCAYARVEDDEDHFVMTGDHATGLPPLRGRFAMSAFGQAALRTMRAGQPWLVVDSAVDPRLDDADRSTYARTGIRAVVTVPLLRAGRFVAGLAVHQAVPRQWAPAEVDLVTVVVNRCWDSIQRVHADEALRDSERRHRLLVERATDVIWVLDHELRFVQANPAACTLFGYDRDELVGRSATDLVAPEDRARLTRVVADLPTVGVATGVWRLRRIDGDTVTVELSIQTTPTGVQAIGRDVTERQRAEAERDLLLRREHEIAEALQRSLLPRELPVLDRLAVSARYLPASTHSQVGGDWYEVLPLDGTTVALSVGDVVGKGPTAAAVMGQLRSALAGYLLDGYSPAAALERLDAFTTRINGAAGSTCACLTFDQSSGRLCWALAGHPPPLVLDADGPRLLTGSTGPVLGAPARPPYREHTTHLASGASVVLYTDGLVEHPGVSIDQGLERLLDAVRDAHAGTPDQLTAAITDALLADGQHDDVALVVTRVLPDPLSRTVPALPGELAVMRREATTWATAVGLSADLRADLQLALGEAAANTVDHAYPDGSGDLTYRVATTPGGIHVTVRDHGRWRPEPADKGTRGRGLQIIRALAEQASIDHDDNGTTVEFHLAHTSDAASAPSAVPVATPPATSAVTPSGDTDISESAPDSPVQLLRLTGDIDTATADTLRHTLASRIGAADHRPVEIDLSQVHYLSSSGIALLLEAAATATRTGRALTVLAIDGTPPARILTLSGLHGLTTDALAVRIRHH
jgi:anti-anti-sigma factor